MRAAGGKASWRESALLLALGLLWGMPYALTKIALVTIPPVTLAAGRVSLAAAALWLVVIWRGGTWPRRNLCGLIFVQGCVACAIPYTLIALGQQTVDSGVASILNSATPVFVCLIGLLWLRAAVTGGQWLGVVTGLAGVVAITGTTALTGFGHAAIGELTILLATFSSAISVILGRRLNTIPADVAAAGTLTASAMLLVPLALVIEAPLASAPSAASLTALVVNALVATGLGFVIYFRLIGTLGIMGTASVGYLKPAFGVAIGCTLLGEPITWLMVVGLAAIVFAVAALNRGSAAPLDPSNARPLETLTANLPRLPIR